MIGPGLLLALLLAASIPPLTPEQRVRLETAADGRDHREEAFVALVENAAAFGASADPETLPGSEPVRLTPDLDDLLADPDAHRGALCRITGVLQQRAAVERAYGAPWEWFVRDPAGRPVLVYVADAAGGDDGAFPVGRPIAVYARFYKPIEAVARDGRTHVYPAFVGARPWRLGAGSDASVLSSAVVGALLLGGLLVVFVVVAVLARRPPSRGRVRAVATGGEIPGDEALPDDPVAALGVLRRRAGRDEADAREDDARADRGGSG